jgi:hypothetical protein
VHSRHAVLHDHSIPSPGALCDLRAPRASPSAAGLPVPPRLPAHAPHPRMPARKVVRTETLLRQGHGARPWLPRGPQVNLSMDPELGTIYSVAVPVKRVKPQARVPMEGEEDADGITLTVGDDAGDVTIRGDRHGTERNVMMQGEGRVRGAAGRCVLCFRQAPCWGATRRCVLRWQASAWEVFIVRGTSKTVFAGLLKWAEGAHGW